MSNTAISNESHLSTKELRTADNFKDSQSDPYVKPYTLKVPWPAERKKNDPYYPKLAAPSGFSLLMNEIEEHSELNSPLAAYRISMRVQNQQKVKDKATDEWSQLSEEKRDEYNVRHLDLVAVWKKACADYEATFVTIRVLFPKFFRDGSWEEFEIRSTGQINYIFNGYAASDFAALGLLPATTAYFGGHDLLRCNKTVAEVGLANYDVIDATGKLSDLYDATEAGDLEEVTSLIQKGACTWPSTVAYDESRPLVYPHIIAAADGHTAIFCALLAAQARVEYRTSSILSDDVNLKADLPATLPVTLRRRNRWAPVDAITAAAKGGHLDIVKVILQHPGLDKKVSYGNVIHSITEGTVNYASVNVRVLDLLFKDIDSARKHDVPPLMHAAAQGHLDVFLALVDAGARITQRTEYIFKDDHAAKERYATCGQSILDWQPIDALTAAVKGGHINVVKAIFERHNLDDAVDVTVVAESEEKRFTVKQANATYSNVFYTRTAKRKVCAKMRYRDVLFRDIADHCKNDPTPLMMAAAQDNFEIAALLVENGAKVNATKGSRLVTALKMAAASNSPTIVALLLQHGAQIGPLPTPEDFEYSTEFEKAKSTIRFAAEWGNADIVKTLIYRGAALEETNGKYYSTLLISAAQYGHIGVVQVLIDAARRRGAEYLSARLEDNVRDISPLRMAAEHGHFEICKLLIQCGAATRRIFPNLDSSSNDEYEHHKTSALLECLNGLNSFRQRALRALLDPNPNPETPVPVGFTQSLNDINFNEQMEPPCTDNDNGFTRTVQMLCNHEAGVLVDQSDEFGMSPLILAVKSGQVEIIKMIVNALKDDPKRLQQYLAHSYTGVGTCCYACPCDAAENSGTALGFAASQDNLELVKLLLGLGASDDLPTDENGFTVGRSALVRAVASGSLEIAQILLDHGSSTELACHREQHTALYVAAGKCDVAMIALLLDNGADIEYQIDNESEFSHDHTPLITAATARRYGPLLPKIDTIQFLLASGAEHMKTAKSNSRDQNDEMWTARDFIDDFCQYRNSSSANRKGEEEQKKRESSECEMLLSFMNRLYSIPDEDYSPARVAIELRLYQLVGSNLRHFRQAFMKNDPRGKGLVTAATTVASWPGAKPVCPITVKVAKAVEAVAKVGWHRDSQWRRVTHWLQSDYVQAVANVLMLCQNRLRNQQQAADNGAAVELVVGEDEVLPLLPVEMWQLFLVFFMPCDAPATYTKPQKLHRTVVAERMAPRARLKRW